MHGTFLLRPQAAFVDGIRSEFGALGVVALCSGASIEHNTRQYLFYVLNIWIKETDRSLGTTTRLRFCPCGKARERPLIHTLSKLFYQKATYSDLVAIDRERGSVRAYMPHQTTGAHGDVVEVVGWVNTRSTWWSQLALCVPLSFCFGFFVFFFFFIQRRAWSDHFFRREKNKFNFVERLILVNITI